LVFGFDQDFHFIGYGEKELLMIDQIPISFLAFSFLEGFFNLLTSLIKIWNANLPYFLIALHAAL